MEHEQCIWIIIYIYLINFCSYSGHILETPDIHMVWMKIFYSKLRAIGRWSSPKHLSLYLYISLSICLSLAFELSFSKIPQWHQWRQWRCSCVYVANFEQISCITLEFPLLTFNLWVTNELWYFYGAFIWKTGKTEYFNRCMFYMFACWYRGALRVAFMLNETPYSKRSFSWGKTFLGKLVGEWLLLMGSLIISCQGRRENFHKYIFWNPVNLKIFPSSWDIHLKIKPRLVYRILEGFINEIDS